MTYIPERDFVVREVELPPSVKGVVTPNDDSTFSIYLNVQLTPEQKSVALQHEIDHILNDDFYTDKSIEEIECL